MRWVFLSAVVKLIVPPVKKQINNKMEVLRCGALVPCALMFSWCILNSVVR
jgi:hypothetical protein